MCFGFDARPPELPADLALRPVAGGAAAEILELTSADGTRFSAALAVAPESKQPAVVILPDVRGLYRFYVELAERFAQAGHSAVTIDYFGRTAGVGERDEDFDFWPHVMETRPRQVQADAAAALDALRERTGETSAVAVGFCFGGLMAYLAATNEELGLDGVVGFYGALDTSRFGMPSPAERAADMRCPVLGLFGGADQGISAEQVAEFERSLADAGVEHDIHTYPGAPHSFFDRHQEEFADASEDAWRRVISFLDQVGASRTPA
jgi:carboxymethylenebutenolidase